MYSDTRIKLNNQLLLTQPGAEDHVPARVAVSERWTAIRRESPAARSVSELNIRSTVSVCREARSVHWLLRRLSPRVGVSCPAR
jgi:hypothetical protein